MSDLTLIVNNGAKVRAAALTWPERARALVVTDDAGYAQGAELLKGIKALRQEVADTFDDHIRRAHEAHKALVREKADAEAPLTEAEGIIKVALVTYRNAQEQKRKDEERRLAEEACRRQQERALAEAAALEAAGEVEEAAALLEDATTAPAPVVVLPSSTPKVSGISYKSIWKFRIVDANKVPREFLCVDAVRIGGVVRALKGATKIPGVEVYEEQIAAASGR